MTHLAQQAMLMVMTDGPSIMSSVSAVTRNRGNATGPASAATEEGSPLGSLGDVIMDPPDDNATDIDVLPAPAQHDALPSGQLQLWFYLQACYQAWCLQGSLSTQHIQALYLLLLCIVLRIVLLSV